MDKTTKIILIAGLVAIVIIGAAMFFAGRGSKGAGLQDRIRDLETDNTRLMAERDTAVAIFNQFNGLLSQVADLTNNLPKQYEQLGKDIEGIKGGLGDIKQLSIEYAKSITEYDANVRKHEADIRRGLDYIEEFESGLQQGNH